MPLNGIRACGCFFIFVAIVFALLKVTCAFGGGSSIHLEPASILIELPLLKTGALAEFELVNDSDEQLRIVGLYRACNCLKTTSPVPRFVPPNGSSKIKFLVVGDKREDSSIAFQIVTDSPHSPYIDGEIRLGSNL